QQGDDRSTSSGARFGEFFRYHGWLAPGVRWFRSIGFPAKSLWVAAAFMAPLLMLVVFLIRDANALLDTARHERDGVAYT
ncbi:hypothetical protein MMY95_15740, partial [Lactiplantibacillus sp. ME-2]|uniref:hypothetical protein n=1 Tax=Lactiplantibacillus sp. ME-2 TaxID=2923377 RepID=UPI001F4B5DE5